MHLASVIGFSNEVAYTLSKYRLSRLPAALKQKLHWMELIHSVEVRVAMERAQADAEGELATEAEYQAVLWRHILN